MIKLFKNKKFKRGFSIPNSILGFSLVTLSALGLISYMGNFQQVKKLYEQQMQQPYDHISLMEGMKNILVQSDVEITSNGVAQVNIGSEGICKAVQDSNVYSDLNSRTAQIKIEKTSLDSSSSIFQDQRWNYFVGSEWTLSSGSCFDGFNGFIGSFTEDYNKKCFKLEGEEIYARLSMTPQKIGASSFPDSAPLVDEVKFDLKSTVSRKIVDSNGQESWGTSIQSSSVYATQVPRCLICESSNKCKYAVLSGSTVGSLLNEGFTYHSPYPSWDICNALDVSHVSKSVPQSSRIVSSSHIETNTSRNVGLSCTTNLFKCNNDSNRFHTRNYDEFFKLNFGLNLDHPDNTYINSIGLNFKKDGSTILTPSEFHLGVGLNLVNATNSTTTIFDPESVPLRSGGNSYELHIKGEGVCETICQHPDQYTPELKVKMNACSSSKTFNLNSSNVACTVCYKKNCHGYGMGSFGPVSPGLPDEPYDGNVPECALNEGVIDPKEPSRGGITIDSSIGAGETLTLQGGELQSSSSPTKTLCFAYGDYRILPVDGGSDACFKVSEQTLKAGTPNSDGIYTSGFLANLSVAYLGEDISTAHLPPDTRLPTPAVIKSYLKNSGGFNTENVPYYGNTIEGYQFYNNATQGLFHTPLNELTQSSDEVEVNFQTDAGEMVHGGWMTMSQVAQNQNNSSTGVFDDTKNRGIAFFYREPFSNSRFTDDSSSRNDRPSRPVLVKLPSNLDFGQSGNFRSPSAHSDHRLLLTNHIRFKGLRLAHTTQTNISYPFLCKKSSATNAKDIFVLKKAFGNAGRNFNQGYTTCGSDHFSPPVNHQEWLSALHAVANNHPRYPFPRPFSFRDGAPFLIESQIKYPPPDTQHSFDYSKGNDSADSDRLDCGGGSLDNNIFIHSGTQNNCSQSALDKVHSAWVAFEPLPGHSTPTDDSASSWFQNLKELNSDYAESGDSYQKSLFVHSEVPNFIQNVFNKVASSQTTDLNWVGALSPHGLPILRRDLREENTSIKLPDLTGVSEEDFRRPCQYTHQATDPLLFKRPEFEDIKASSWKNCPTAQKQSDITGADFERMAKGIYTTAFYYPKKVTEQNIFPVINKDKFCTAWKFERERRRAAKYIIDEYLKNSVQNQIRTCRDDYIDDHKTRWCEYAVGDVYATAATRSLTICNSYYNTCKSPCSRPCTSNYNSCRQINRNCNGLTEPQLSECQNYNQNVNNDNADCLTQKNECEAEVTNCIDECDTHTKTPCEFARTNFLNSFNRTASENTCKTELDTWDWNVTIIDSDTATTGGIFSFRGSSVYFDRAEVNNNYNNSSDNRCWNITKLKPFITMNWTYAGSFDDEVGVLNDGQPLDSPSFDPKCAPLNINSNIDNVTSSTCSSLTEDISDIETSDMCGLPEARDSFTIDGNWPY